MPLSQEILTFVNTSRQVYKKSHCSQKNLSKKKGKVVQKEGGDGKFFNRKKCLRVLKNNNTVEGQKEGKENRHVTFKAR